MTALLQFAPIKANRLERYDFHSLEEALLNFERANFASRGGGYVPMARVKAAARGGPLAQSNRVRGRAPPQKAGASGRTSRATRRNRSSCRHAGLVAPAATDCDRATASRRSRRDGQVRDHGRQKALVLIGPGCLVHGRGAPYRGVDRQIADIVVVEPERELLLERQGVEPTRRGKRPPDRVVGDAVVQRIEEPDIFASVGNIRPLQAQELQARRQSRAGNR
jgi:hypothetical protein